MRDVQETGPKPAAPRDPLLPLAASLTLGAAGLLVLGAQPLLYGSYVHERRITEAGLGLLAAIEITAIALGSAGGIALLGRIPARLVALTGIGLTIAANLLPAAVSLLLARAISGTGGGLLVAIAAAAIARRSRLNAAAAAFLFLQAASQYAILQWFSAEGGAASAGAIQHALAVIAALTALMLPLPASLAPAQHAQAETQATGLPPLSGWIALGASALLVGGIVGIWAYMGLWLELRGVPADRITPMLTASMIGQMVGSLVAVALGERGHSGGRVIAMAAVLLGIVGWLLLRGADGPLGWALIVGYGVVWMIATPALTGFLLEADPTRRSLPFSASAQLLGAAIVPTVAGMAFAESGLDTVLVACAGALVASLVLILTALAARLKPAVYAV